MSSFIGFSEDDIQKVQHESNTKAKPTQKEFTASANIKVKKASFKVQPKHSKKVEVQNVEVLELPKSRLFTSVDNKTEISLSKAKAGKQTEEKKDQESNKENEHNNDLKEHLVMNDEPANGINTISIDGETNSMSQDAQKPNKQKFKDLEEFQIRQKQIEEQNKRRKELLTKALEDRTKRTQEEAQRLTEIQNEFKKLDAILSNDVKILRNKIEVASVDYMEAQKRYHKIEKEFLDAKLVLHKKLENKEMLTEHLCTIIEENEERKAKKLTELLNKLQVTENTENYNENNDKNENIVDKS